MPSINIAEAVSSTDARVLPQQVWFRCDGDSIYILIQTKGLSQFLQSAKATTIFLSLYFDSDGNVATGSSGQSQKIAGQPLSGFDFVVDFSTALTVDEKDRPYAVPNCQVSKWNGTRFIGNLAWGCLGVAGANNKMSASASGDYASFTIPRSILNVAPTANPARVAFRVGTGKTTYVDGKPLIVKVNMTEAPDRCAPQKGEAEKLEQWASYDRERHNTTLAINEVKLQAANTALQECRDQKSLILDQQSLH
jgi:hypothetical protein